MLNMHRPRTLRARLFFWFLGAIFLAIATSSVIVASTRPEPIIGAEAMTAHVASRLADVWDDGEATRAYVGEVRDVTGFDVRLVRDPHTLPRNVHRAAWVGRTIVSENAHHIFVPVVRGGSLVGALEMEKFGPRPMAWFWLWWRFALALGATSVLLSVMAGGAANRLARPLEQLALAADRFGAGDLRFRATPPGRRWGVMEVRDVALSFNRMADRVEAMVRGQRELLGAISHELRSPLGRARIALEIARERLSGDGGEKRAASASSALDDLERQLGSIDAILGDLLDVTRAGLADLHRTEQPFAAWLRERLAEEPSPPRIELTMDRDSEELALSFDGPLLARALHNLLVNARDHGHPEAEPIHLEVGRRPGQLRLVVRDRGPGFPEALVGGGGEAAGARAFEPFVRGDASRSRPASGAGSGLGLAIVRRIVEAHGGRVFARNAPSARNGRNGEESERANGKGAEVGFELPL
jgi:two-component system OmpR family sensor kinase